MSERRPAWYRVGHATNEPARTGCTVILFDEPAPACVDVRGGAPGTRETDLLASGRLVRHVDALLLSGGSAFGLGAADGVVRLLSERGRGFPTSARPVPIVPAAVIFDLTVGIPEYPTADDGYRAASSASRDVTHGRTGAGAGAMVAKLGGAGTPGGLGLARVQAGDADVTAIVVLNAVGDVRDPATGRWLATTRDPEDRGRSGRELAIANIVQAQPGEHTTIGVILVSAHVDYDTLTRCCVAAHDALARCVVPAHTLFDGDTFFAAAPSVARVTPLTVTGIAAAAELAVERAIVSIFDHGVAGGASR